MLRLCHHTSRALLVGKSSALKKSAPGPRRPLRLSSPSASTLTPLIATSAGSTLFAASSSQHNHIQTRAEHAIASYPVRKVKVLKASTLKEKFWRLLRIIKRCLQLGLHLFPVVLFLPLLSIGNDDDGDDDSSSDRSPQKSEREMMNAWHSWYYEMALRQVEKSGAAIIKLMQWASSRPDLFGVDFCSIFERLQDSTTPHPYSHTELALQDAFGMDWKSRISLGKLLGSGCIGQVYEGSLLEHGNDKVAVKILHPNVEADIDADLDILRLAVQAAKLVPSLFETVKWLNWDGIVEEFASLLKIQLDLRNEAKHLNQFNENFKDNPNVEFPKLVSEFPPTQQVLVETFVDGIPIMEFARKFAHDKKLLSEKCYDAITAVCQMIFLDNFVHGDLHPGNVFISRDGKKFILFDVGIVAEYDDADHEAIVDILTAFIRKNGNRAGRLMIDDSNARLRGTDQALQEELFIKQIEMLTDHAKDDSNYVMKNLGYYITWICDASSKHHVMLNESFMSAALAVKIQEGIAIALDPSVQIKNVAIPIIMESERRRFGVTGGISKWFHALFDKDEDVDKAILKRRQTLLDERRNKKQQRQP